MFLNNIQSQNLNNQFDQLDLEDIKKDDNKDLDFQIKTKIINELPKRPKIKHNREPNFTQIDSLIPKLGP